MAFPQQLFHSDIYTISESTFILLVKVQTCEKLGGPHCGFFPAAQIFHSDIYTTLMKVKTCEGGGGKGGFVHFEVAHIFTLI